MELPSELIDELVTHIGVVDRYVFSLTCQQHRRHYRSAPTPDERLEWIGQHRPLETIIRFQDEDRTKLLLNVLIRYQRWNEVGALIDVDKNPEHFYLYFDRLVSSLLKANAPIEPAIRLIRKVNQFVAIERSLGKYGRLDIFSELYWEKNREENRWKKLELTLEQWKDFIEQLIHSLTVVDWRTLYRGYPPVQKIIDHEPNHYQFTCRSSFYKRTPILAGNLIGFLRLFSHRRRLDIISHNLMHCGNTTDEMRAIIRSDPGALKIFNEEFKIYPDMEDE